MRTKAVGKLIMAGVSLLMAVVLLAVGTFAWFTFSTAPEVSGISVTFSSDTAWPFEVCTDYLTNPDNPTWEKELNVSDILTKAALRPISTYDLQHWYLADYDYAGNVTKLIEVPLSDVANREDKTAASANPDEDGINYLLYFDMWVRTRDPELTYELRLNNPSAAAGAPTVNDWETVYGTYVLWTPVWNPAANDGEGAYTTADDAMASIRVGFQMFGQTNETQSNVVNTVIYEPNVDLHNGLRASEAYSGITYVKGEDADSDGKINDATASGLVTTTVPHYTGTDAYEMKTQETILQRTSSWDAGKLASLEKISQWDSRCIGSIGEFVDADGNPIDNADLPCMAQISRDTPQKIRVFFWLEGQDADCWNQIAGGSIYANLEFRGDAVNAAE